MTIEIQKTHLSSIKIDKGSLSFNKIDEALDELSVGFVVLIRVGWIAGQTILYMATIIGNQKMVELLLKYRVRGRSNKVTVAAETTPTTESAAPTKKRISNSIQALMSRLNVNLKADSNHSTNSHSLSPVEVCSFFFFSF